MEQLIDNRYTDKGTSHSYIEIYEKIFTKIKDTASNVLEIGIMEGGSIDLWSKYFTNAKIYAIDIDFTNDKCDLKNNKKVILINENAYSDECANKLPTFDIVLDDGPHTLESMIIFAKIYSNKLNPGGIWVLEDVPDSSWIPKIINNLPKHIKNNAIVYDRRHIKGRGDDIMIVAYNL
jgi:hypothetical protein